MRRVHSIHDSRGAHFLARWAAIYSVVALASGFLHQVGHGVGAWIDGIHLSTGFTTAGDPGKRPSEPDFRAATPLTGRLSSAALLGPMVNWVLGTACVVALGWIEIPRRFLLWVLALGMASGWVRIYPISRFLLTTVRGPLFLDDEATWGLAASGGFAFPTTYAEFDRFLAVSGNAILSPQVFFWPAFSFGLSVLVLALTCRAAARLLGDEIRGIRAWFYLTPVWLGVVLIPLAFWLDERIRVQW